MAVEHFMGVVFGEHPVVEYGEVMLPTEDLDEITALVALYQHLRRIEALQQLVDVFVVALGQVELSCGDIQKGYA